MCAAFIEESRIKLVDANQLHRKSGGKDRQMDFSSIKIQPRDVGPDRLMRVLL
jgi:hypothetical protein